MKGLNFTVGADLDSHGASRFAWAHLVGVDRMPWLSQVDRRGRLMTIRRAINESGQVHIPWPVEGYGDVFVQTASLMERDEPYRLGVELARGEVNKVRNQLAEWESIGFKASDDLQALLKAANSALQKAIRATDDQLSQQFSQAALRASLRSAETLAEEYSRRVIHVRRRHGGKIDTRLGCAVDTGLLEGNAKDFRETFDQVTVPINWGQLESRQGEFEWDKLDQRVEWAKGLGVPFSIGPLLDFRRQALPDWLWLWESDVQTVATFMMDLVESCIARYKGQATFWETTARTNSADLLSLNEEQMLWVAARMLEIGKGIDPTAKFIIGIDQPWGEYLAREERSYSPFTFVDTLNRMRLPLSAINLEVAMTYSPGGSYCRSLLDFSRMLDHYHEIGLPVHLRLYFPSGQIGAREPGQTATDAGVWHATPQELVQAEWAEKFVAVALAKPFVEVITWGHYHDRADNDWPGSGLVGANGRRKPVFDRLRKVRHAYLDG